MSDVLIAAQQKRIDDLTNENASLKAENKDRRVKARKVEGERDDALKQLEAAAKDRDDFKVKAEATPKDLQAKVDDLTGQIRSRDHRDAFASVSEFEAAGADGKAQKFKLAEGVKPESVWQLTGYKAEGETPDAKSVSAKYAEARASHPYLFAAADDNAPGGATRPIALQGREAGPGGGRGTSPTVTASQGSQSQPPANYIPGRL